VEPLSRPGPSRSFAERVRAWVTWFGLGRLVASSAATVVVCAGAFWLVRTPPPATESSLPRASTTLAAAASEPVPLPSSGAESVALLVHVAGAVVEPGVYRLDAGGRVRDAVVAAGGPTGDADWNALNLAAPVVDGSKVYVPRVGEEVPAALTVPSVPTLANATPMPVDVNAATASELDELPGIGPAIAAAIVTERERNGPFLDVDDLDRVPGLGPAKLEALRDLVST
jgi:competence protein ComEA